MREHSAYEQTGMELGRAPVAEASVGFYFQRIEGWTPVHQGALWEKFRAKYPGLEILQPVVDVTPPTPPVTLVTDFASFLVRTCFVDTTKSQLVQSQNGLLLHNWRKSTDAPDYQHYEGLCSMLREDWNKLRTFLRERDLKSPLVKRCEISYFNHLVRGQEWQDFSDLPKIFNVWKGCSESASTGKLQMASFAISYRLEKGTVNASVQPAIRSTDGKEIIQFTLSSSGEPADSHDPELFRCLDECHENAKRVFMEFTTDQARERWK
jgi:uncharacterized protein (TIGR04255 family)